MAFELLYDVMRVTANDNTTITAIIRNSVNQTITTGETYLVIPELGMKIAGTYNRYNSEWEFIIPATDVSGRYYYYFEHDGTVLDFRSAIYFER